MNIPKRKDVVLKFKDVLSNFRYLRTRSDASIQLLIFKNDNIYLMIKINRKYNMIDFYVEPYNFTKSKEIIRDIVHENVIYNLPLVVEQYDASWVDEYLELRSFEEIVDKISNELHGRLNSLVNGHYECLIPVRKVILDGRIEQVEEFASDPNCDGYLTVTEKGVVRVDDPKEFIELERKRIKRNIDEQIDLILKNNYIVTTEQPRGFR